VRVFGGCCGSDEHYITALAGAIEEQIGEPVPQTPRPAPGHQLATERAVYPEGAEMQTVDIRTQADIDELAEEQLYFEGPVCLRGTDPLLLRAALTVYQGRALVDCPVPVDFPGAVQR